MPAAPKICCFLNLKLAINYKQAGWISSYTALSWHNMGGTPMAGWRLAGAALKIALSWQNMGGALMERVREVGG